MAKCLRLELSSAFHIDITPLNHRVLKSICFSMKQAQLHLTAILPITSLCGLRPDARHHCRLGLGALELFALGLKSTGRYLSRSLSFAGAEFNIARRAAQPSSLPFS